MAGDGLVYGAFHESDYQVDVFDMSLFEKNDPQLAKQVADIIHNEKINFPGIAHVRLSYVLARNFVSGGLLYQALSEWAEAPVKRVKDARKNYHFKELSDFIYGITDASALYTRLKHIIDLWNRNGKRVNRVYYGWLAGY